MPAERESSRRVGAWLAAVVCACNARAARAPSGAPTATVPAVAPAPRGNPMTAEKVALGAALFFETRLSSSGEVSCASCHDIVAGGNGAGHTPVSYGIGGRAGRRNAPTVWNAGLRAALFWDGRAASLEEQAAGPLMHPAEMGMADAAAVTAALEASAEYPRAFAVAFADDRRRTGRARIELAEVVAAIACFERTLTTPDAPFDRAQRGEVDAMPEAARRGWATFQRLGCVACHGAPTFTGTDFFARFPLRAAPEIDYVLGVTQDPGRGDTAAGPRGNHTWRVPSLRNVALTAPYFHNGSATSLEQAVRVMGRAQLARTLTRAEVGDVTAFLRSLTGVRPDIRPPDIARR